MPYGEIPRGLDDMKVYIYEPFYVVRWLVQKARTKRGWFGWQTIYQDGQLVGMAWRPIKRVKGQGWVWSEDYDQHIRVMREAARRVRLVRRVTIY